MNRNCGTSFNSCCTVQENDSVKFEIQKGLIESFLRGLYILFSSVGVQKRDILFSSVGVQKI